MQLGAFSARLNRRQSLCLYLDIVPFALHAVAYHCIVGIRAILTIRDVASNCDEGWILAFAF